MTLVSCGYSGIFLGCSALFKISLSVYSLAVSMFIVVPAGLSFSAANVLRVPLLGVALSTSFVSGSKLTAAGLILVGPSAMSTRSLSAASGTIAVPADLSFSAAK